jgi:hypothetical protein
VKIALVSTWGIPCGIAEHAASLKEAVEAADPAITLTPLPDALDPLVFNGHLADDYDLLYLDYHAALHSRWTPAAIQHVQQAGGLPVVVTYHDTGVPNTDQCKGIVAAADAAVVHEPFDDLPAEKTHYWRMGVPAWEPPVAFGPWADERLVLGTVGFPLPWKNYDELCWVTRAAGWALLLIAPTATAADIMRWEAINPSVRTLPGVPLPSVQALPDFLPARQVVSALAGCDATAFCYTCANAGQSGAILQGIAARKPVIAFRACRQMRALYLDELGHRAIRWCDTFEAVQYQLTNATPIWRVDIWRVDPLTAALVDPLTAALADQDSWARLGAKYAQLFRSLGI